MERHSFLRSNILLFLRHHTPTATPTETVVHLNGCKNAVQIFVETDIEEFATALM